MSQIFSDLAERISAARDPDGYEIGLEFLKALTGRDWHGSEIVRGDWREAFSAVDYPLPLGTSFLHYLSRCRRLSPEQSQAVSMLLKWYDDFSGQFSALISSPEWQTSMLESVLSYASGERPASFRPYYDVLTIEPDRFLQWGRELSLDSFSAIADVNSWRGPVELMGMLRDGYRFDLDHCRTDTAVDYHVCGSTSYLLLGETGHPGFDSSRCWICPGAESRACGSLCVDVRD